VKLGVQPTNADTASGMSRMKNLKMIAKIDPYQGTKKQMTLLVAPVSAAVGEELGSPAMLGKTAGFGPVDRKALRASLRRTT
jgi:hypothetical protein